MTGKAINYTPEYSSAQKTRIANTFLEFYKDGKYMFKPDEKRQNQGYYNHKSEIVSNLDKWCNTQSAFVKYIIPIIDYNLETDLDAIEGEWVKNHKLRCDMDDLKRENQRMKDHMEHKAEKRAEELKKEWVSEVEDVVKLQNALDESEQKRIADIRKWRMKCAGWDNKENQLVSSIERLRDELRETRTKAIEMELDKKTKKEARDKEVEDLKKELIKVKKETEKQVSNLQKQNDALVKKDIKSETTLLKGEKIKLEYDMLKIKYKEYDTQLKLLKSENATLRQMVQVQVQAPLPQEPEEAQESPLIRSV